MSTKTKTIIGSVITLIIAVIVIFFFLRYENEVAMESLDTKNIENESHDIQEGIIKSKFGFQVPIPEKWRLANLLSSFADSIERIDVKYGIDMIISDDLTQIMDLQKIYQKHGKELAKLIQFWEPQESENIILTTMNAEEERYLHDNFKSSLELKKIIGIKIAAELPDLSSMKEERTDKSVKIIFKLEDGTTAYYINMLGMKSMEKRIIWIPIETQKIMTNGKVAKGIYIEVGDDDMNETDFINWAKKIKINLPQ